MTLPKKRWKFFSVYPSSLNDELLWLYYYYYKHLWHDYIHHDLKQDLLFYLQIWVNSQVFKSTKITIFEGENRSKMLKKMSQKSEKFISEKLSDQQQNNQEIQFLRKSIDPVCWTLCISKPEGLQIQPMPTVIFLLNATISWSSNFCVYPTSNNPTIW